MDEKKIKQALSQFKDKRVAVVGDVMIDWYTFGDVKRISEEAPIPILAKTSEKFVLGGAGNVAANLSSLGARVHLFGIVGDDRNASLVLDLLKDKNIGAGGIIKDASRPTVVKHRFVSDAGHQFLRVDGEKNHSLTEHDENKLAELIAAALDGVDLIVLSDYAKGIFSENLAAKIVAIAKTKNKLIAADFKPQNKEKFIGVDLISPNLREAKEMTGKEDIEEIGAVLREYFDADVMLTRGGDGISVFMRHDGSHHPIPGRKIKLFDVSGAGDTTIAVAALGIVSGLDLRLAATIANIAGSIVVQKPGTATISFEELSSGVFLGHHIDSLEMVPKVWGYEKWIENNEKYCSKLLSLNEGYQCSLHYHKIKDETFLVIKGHVRLEAGGEVIHLREGDFKRISPGTRHRFAGIEDSLIIEISTHHDDGDSYRLEESRKMDTVS
jgi:D-glycero-beta-D-manno-heptose-7-phosphate kinase